MENNVVYDAVEGVKLKADELLSDCESMVGGINSIQSSVTQLLGKSYVKSVQRGQYNKSSGTIRDDMVVANISSVNTSKSILIVDYTAIANTPGYYFYLESNAIKVCTGRQEDASPNLYLYWQVIEFY